jgi:hypothetical protein
VFGVKDSDLKTRTRVGNSVDIELWKKFEKLSKDSRITKSKLLDEALELVLKKHGRK